MGLVTERHFTHDHWVLNRTIWSTHHGSQILLGLLVTLLVPPGATTVIRADGTVERRSRWKITEGCYRGAVCSLKAHVVHCFRPQWWSMLLWVPVPWARRLWACVKSWGIIVSRLRAGAAPYLAPRPLAPGKYG